MDDAAARVAEPGGLAGHLDGFVRAVREAGIPASRTARTNPSR